MFVFMSVKSQNYLEVRYDTLIMDNMIIINKFICIKDSIKYANCFTIITTYDSTYKKVISEYNKAGNVYLEGTQYEYHNNGKMKSVSTYLQNIPVGYYIEFYSNGRVMTFGQYSYDIRNVEYDTLQVINDSIGIIETKYMIDYDDRKIGEWFYFDSSGLLIKKEDYNKKRE